jgi:hypothetical protein
MCGSEERQARRRLVTRDRPPITSSVGGGERLVGGAHAPQPVIVHEGEDRPREQRPSTLDDMAVFVPRFLIRRTPAGGGQRAGVHHLVLARQVDLARRSPAARRGHLVEGAAPARTTTRSASETCSMSWKNGRDT